MVDKIEMNAALNLIKENKKREVFRDKRQIELDKLKAQASFTRSRLKIRMPDDMVIVASFGAKESVQDVYDWLKQNLINKERQFILYETPPKRILQASTSRLFQVKLVPSGSLYFGWKDLDSTKRTDGPFLDIQSLK